MLDVLEDWGEKVDMINNQQFRRGEKINTNDRFEIWQRKFTTGL